MKKILLFTLVGLLIILSCKKEEEETPVTIKKKEVIRYDFGFKLNDFEVINDTIQSGDTFGSILENRNFNSKEVFNVVEQVKDSFNIKILRVGRPYTLLMSKDSIKKVKYFIYQPDRVHYYVVNLKDSIATASKKSKPVTFKRRTLASSLEGSLSETLYKEGATDELTMQIMDIFKWSVDFFKSQKGDKFAVTFTERYINDTIYDGVESLEAAFFEYKGKNVYAFDFIDETTKKSNGYYDEEGKPLKSFFLKAPLNSFRISSRYSSNRFHPVQKRFKAHKGTDYAAPTGTPIMSTANGVVEKVGFSLGNGNYVKVKHNSTYSTQYLHMSKILVRRGQRVSQGQTIGKVGSTGLASGPHVCYRFWKNGVQVDALKQVLPSAPPMTKEKLPKFNAIMAPLRRELDSVANLKLVNK